MRAYSSWWGRWSHAPAGRSDAQRRHIERVHGDRFRGHTHGERMRRYGRRWAARGRDCHQLLLALARLPDVFLMMDDLQRNELPENGRAPKEDDSAEPYQTSLDHLYGSSIAPSAAYFAAWRLCLRRYDRDALPGRRSGVTRCWSCARRFQPRGVEQRRFLQFQRAAFVRAAAGIPRAEIPTCSRPGCWPRWASTPLSSASIRQAAPIAFQQAPPARGIGFAHKSRIVHLLADEIYVFKRQGA